jgi:amino acid transporter
MMPYDKLPESSALATAFDNKGFPAAKYIVAIGAICGISSSALDGLFPIPRIIYAMASDRLIFSFLGKVNERTGTPIIACVVSGLLTALLAMFLKLSSLAEMLSIGTLLSYTIVSISVLLLRYRPGTLIEDNDDGDSAQPRLDKDIVEDDHLELSDDATEGKQTATKRINEIDDKEDMSASFSSNKDSSNSSPVLERIIKTIIGRRLEQPTDDSYLVVKIALGVFILNTIGLQSCLIWGMDRLTAKHPLIIAIFVLFLMWMLLAVDVIARQPQSKHKLMFKVPFLPFLPLAAVFINVFLLLELETLTWVRFAVWMFIG